MREEEIMLLSECEGLLTTLSSHCQADAEAGHQLGHLPYDVTCLQRELIRRRQTEALQ